MKVGTIQKLLVLLSVVLVAADAYVFVETRNTKKSLGKWHKSIVIRLRKELDETRSDRAKVPTARSYDHLKSMGNLVAGVVKAPVVTEQPKGPDKPDPRKNHPPLDTLIVVRGIGFPDVAFLEPPATAKKEGIDVYFFGANEEISFAPGASILRIGKEKVTFQYYDDEVDLPVQEASTKSPGGPGAKPGTGGSGPVAPIAVAANGVEWTPGQNVIKVSRGARRTIRDRGEQEVLKGVSFKKVRWTDGKPMISVSALPPSGVLAKGGIQQGDALLSINGRRLGTKAAAANYIKSNPNLPAYTVKIVRNGQVVTRTVRIK